MDKRLGPRPLRRCFLEDSAQSPPRSLGVLLGQSADHFEQGILLAKQLLLTHASGASRATLPMGTPGLATPMGPLNRTAAAVETVPTDAGAAAAGPAVKPMGPLNQTAAAVETVPTDAGAAAASPAVTVVTPSTAQFEASLDCADEALRLDGRSVEALHNRGLALQELGQLTLSRDAFTRALAIDPDDPETLAGAADLYINRLPPSADFSEIGVEYAHRGSQRLRRSLGPSPSQHDLPKDKAKAAKAKEYDERALLGRLLLLEAQGLNDLGRPREALQRLDVAIATSDSSQARYERAMALLDLCRFVDARRAFFELLAHEPGDAWAHYSLGLTLEMLGQQAAADEQLTKARQLAPREFPELLPVNSEQFRALVDQEVKALTPAQRADLRQVTLQTADLPEISDLTAEDPPLSPTILGLFRGLPLAEAAEAAKSADSADSAGSAGSNDREPRAIVLYRKNLLRAVHAHDELIEQIRTTLLHELGHLRGEDDAELRARGLE